MGRIRTIKPEFHAHEDLSELPPETHLLASALVNYADDEGYFNANPVLLKAGTNPLRHDATPLSDQLLQLIRVGYIDIRNDGKRQYGKVVSFQIHQRVSHPAPSKLRPLFEAIPEKLRSDSGATPEEFRNDSALNREGNREQGKEQGKEVGCEPKTLAPASTAVAVPASPAFIALPLTGKKHHLITEADVASYEQSYPAVDVRQQLREVCEWLKAHPDKRSHSVTGSRQRIARWLGREQDKGGRNEHRSATRNDSVGRVQRSLDAWDRVTAERLGGAGPDGTLPPDAGVLPASGVP